MSKRKKFKKRFVVIPLLVLAIGGGGISGIMYYRESSTVAKVVNIDDINYSYMMEYDSEKSFSGSLKKGSVANVKVQEDLKINEVKVKKGDTVKQGDTLLVYDTQSLEFNVENCENKLKTLENNTKIANNELNVLKKLRPSEEAPQEDEQPVEVETDDVPVMNEMGSGKLDCEDKLTASSKALSGTGSAENPLTYNVTDKSVVTKEFLSELSHGNIKAVDTDSDTDSEEKHVGSQYALLYVYSEEGVLLYGRMIDGTKLSDENVKDWVCSDGVTVGENGMLSFGHGTADFASVVVFSQGGLSYDGETEGSEGLETPDMFDFEEASGESQQGVDNVSDEITEKDNYIYSKQELKDMISSKEKKIADLALEKKQADIDLRKAKKLLETGSEIAEIDGTVTFVAKDIKHLSDDGNYITITNNDGMSIVSSIDEFSLDEIEIGQTAEIENYNDGSVYRGKVTSISDTPIVDSSESGVDPVLSTESMYEFTVTVSEKFSLSGDNYVNVKLIGSEERSGLCIESAFVREENGRHYVMVANDENVIEKRYVTVGKNYYGFATEIKSGLDGTERFALPYGKTKEGMPVKEVSYTQLYGIF